MHAVSLHLIKDPIVDDELMTRKVITEPQQKNKVCLTYMFQSKSPKPDHMQSKIPKADHIQPKNIKTDHMKPKNTKTDHMKPKNP